MDNPAVNHRRGTDETLIPPGKTQFTSEKEQQKKFDPTTPHGENGRSSPPPGRFKRFRAHLRRCWMWYLGGSLLFNTIFVILLFLVILPAIVHAVLSSTGLPIITSGLSQPTKDTIDVSLQTSLRLPLGIKARMDAQTIGIYSHKADVKPFLELDLPEYHLKGTTDIIVVNQTRPILNETGLAEFLRDALESNNFTVFIRSKTAIHLTSVLKFDVNMAKSLDVPGMSSLHGLTVSKIGLAHSGTENSGLRADVLIPNDSSFMIEMGNLTQNIYSGDYLLGTGVLENFALHPHSNRTFNLEANIDVDTAMQNMDQILASQAESLARGKIALTTTIDKAIFNGTEIPYFEYALKNLRPTSEVDADEVLNSLDLSL